MKSYLGKVYGRISKDNILKQTVKEAWDQIDSEWLNEMIRTMLKRLSAVIGEKGKATR